MIQSLTASSLYDGETVRGATTITWADGVIVELRDAQSTERRDAALVAPGYLDLQVNGIGDQRVVDGDILGISARLRTHGVTSWLPTIPTQHRGFYTNDTITALLANIEKPAAVPQAMGLHFEGPLLGGRPGAHHASFFDVERDVIDILALGRMVTLAPEHPLAERATRQLADQGVLVSLGHSSAGSEQIHEFVRNGGRCATHVFNAMTGIDHVDGGVALDVLTDSRLHFSVIADLQHVTARALRLAWMAAGRRMFVVSDLVSIEPSSEWNSAARLRGAVVGVDEGIRNLVQRCDIPLADALGMVTRVPADLLRVNDRGRLHPGCRADIVLLDSDLRVDGVVCNGFPASD